MFFCFIHRTGNASCAAAVLRTRRLSVASARRPIGNLSFHLDHSFPMEMGAVGIHQEIVEIVGIETKKQSEHIVRWLEEDTTVTNTNRTASTTFDRTSITG
jgi:hypothetical protein